MKTKPILFSTPMVKAILEGRKTQTRRIVKIIPEDTHKIWFDGAEWIVQNENDLCWTKKLVPKYQEDDILWVRETWRIVGWNIGDPFKIQFKDGSVINDIYFNEEMAIDYNIQSTNQCLDAGLISKKDGYFHFDLKDCPTKWKPSIFMPKEAARIFLKVTNIRAERLEEITIEDAINEGIEIWQQQGCTRYKSYIKPMIGFWEHSNTGVHPAIASFRSLWAKMNGFESLNSNPFVWVYEFEKIEKPKNFIK